METFLLKALSCPPNKKILLDILRGEFNFTGFEALSLEFPIVQETDYGFVDLFGLDEGVNGGAYVFIETKSDFPLAQRQAEDDLKEYSSSYSEKGLFSDDMTRLYHQTVFEKNRHTYDPKRKSLFLPLVLSHSLIESTSGKEFENVLADFAKFMGERICRRLPALEKSIRTLLNEELVPRYPNLVIEDGRKRLVTYCYDFRGDPVTREIPLDMPGLLDQVPSREGTCLNNNQLFRLLSNAKNKRAFAIHYNLSGYHRPNLFLEIDGEKFVCLQHIGLGRLNYMGIYDQKAVLDYDDSMIYSTVLVDEGYYWISRIGKQMLFSQLVGERFQGMLKLSFGASISFMTKFVFGTGQTTLA